MYQLWAHETNLAKRSVCAKVTGRLLEAHARGFWQPDAAMLDALRRANDELEDKLEGVGMTEAVA